MEYAHRCLDRHDMFGSCDVLHISPSGTPLISDHKGKVEFTINLTTAAMAKATDWAGVRSGKDYDKWHETGLTPLPGEKVSSPTIGESPLSIECRVKTIMSLGSHDMFIAEVLNVRADDRFIDPETGRFSLEKSGIMAYSHGQYFELGDLIGKFGFSVQKRK